MSRLIRFELFNGLTESQVRQANYVIYGHNSTDGLYIGRAKDPVSRWFEHVNDAKILIHLTTKILLEVQLGAVVQLD